MQGTQTNKYPDDDRSQLRWLVIAALISFTVALILVSLHVRERRMADSPPASALVR